jgi:hypothetical protein
MRWECDMERTPTLTLRFRLDGFGFDAGRRMGFGGLLNDRVYLKITLRWSGVLLVISRPLWKEEIDIHTLGNSRQQRQVLMLIVLSHGHHDTTTNPADASTTITITELTYCKRELPNGSGMYQCDCLSWNRLSD